MKSVEQLLSEAKQENVTLIESHKAALAAKDATITAQAAEISTFKKAAVTAQVNAAIAEAKLPEAAATYVRKQFEGKETPELLKEAVEAVKPVAAVKITRNNGSQQVQEAVAYTEADIKRTMKENRVNEKEARIFLGLD